MANSRRKNGSCTRGRFKLKKLGKGWSTLRKKRQPERVILRITDPEPASTEAAAAGSKSQSSKSQSKADVSAAAKVAAKAAGKAASKL